MKSTPTLEALINFPLFKEISRLNRREYIKSKLEAKCKFWHKSSSRKVQTIQTRKSLYDCMHLARIQLLPYQLQQE